MLIIVRNEMDLLGGMMSDTRDDFSKEIKAILCERVGGKCSNPSCRRMTIGPHSDPNKRLSIGEAAHITAATAGGPRYNGGLTSQQRASIDNGIWLCSDCATMIDKDAEQYPVDLLIEWKKQAESEQLNRVLNLNQKENALSVNISKLDDTESIEMWRNLLSSIEQYQSVLDYAVQYFRLNFKRFGDKQSIQDEIDLRRDNLYKDGLDYIYSAYNDSKIQFTTAFTRVLIELSVYLKMLVSQYIDKMTFNYESDCIGMVNYYWSEFFLTLENNYSEIKTIKDQIDVVIRTEYRNRFGIRG